MSSLLTNASAMVALQTLKGVNKSLAAVQDQISTGKRIANAWDNAALWGISATMESDATAFRAISESLALGSATLSVARDGAETIADLLDQMKGKIVAAQEDNVDRAKVQADVAALRDQITTVTDAASFNGLNLLQGASEMRVEVLASLNRSADQSVSASMIGFDRATLETGTAGDATTFAYNAAADGPTAVYTSVHTPATAASDAFTVGDRIALQLTNAAGQGVVLSYEIQATDLDGVTDTVMTTFAAAVSAMDDQLDAADAAGLFDRTGVTIGFSGNTLTYADDGTEPHAVTARGAVGGGLTAVALFDVSSAGGAAAALGEIEAAIQTAIDAAAGFGSAQGRIQTQSDYIARIVSSLSYGVGALVDADMEEASAELQALQVQQQLGIQALSIANQSPQNILALFA